MRFLSRLKKILYWLPIIWRDGDWDHHFFFKVMAHKLASMERFFAEEGKLRGADRNARRIKEARILSERLRDEFHGDNAFRRYYGRWGESILSTEPIPGSDRHILNVEMAPGAKTKQEKRMAMIDFDLAHDQDRYLRQQDVDRLTEIIRRYSHHWWD